MTEVVEITGIASGGAGVGRLADGRAVFVHRTALGDRARIDLIEEKKTWARGSLVALETVGEGRRQAPCRYYDLCGGCTLEHLEYQAQLDAKARIVHDALTRIGRLATAPPEVTGSPTEFRYRNRVSFTLLRLAHRVVAGFHELERPGRVLDVGAECLLPEDAVASAWRSLRAGWGAQASRLPSGPRLRLTLRAASTGAVSLVVESGHGAGQPDRLLTEVEELRSIWHRPRPDAELILLAGDEALAESWQNEDLDLSGSVFLQVNRAAARLLEEHVLAVLGDVAGKTVVDVFCGIGLHARRLARSGARVTGIELDPLAVRAARAAASDGCDFIEGRAEDLLPGCLPADVVIVNPPRAGLHASTCAALRTRPAGRLLYISCDPATLARDLNRLSPAYRLRQVRCFDLFPQTAHVETVVELTCSST